MQLIEFSPALQQHDGVSRGSYTYTILSLQDREASFLV